MSELNSLEAGSIQTPCPACAATSFTKQFRKKERDFWRCDNCGLERIFPLPSLEEQKAYYDRSYEDGLYRSFTDAEEMKRLTARKRLQAVLGECRPGRWLDVGCSNGEFVLAACGHGLEAEGIDLSEVAIKAAQDRGIPAQCTTVEALRPSHPYDTVTMFDVLEHVQDPLGLLQAVRRILTPGGTVAICVPNQGSLIRRLMRSRWYFYIPEEHLHYFNPSTIRLLLDRAGFEVVRQARAYKPLTYRYSMLQFQEYNPWIYRTMRLPMSLIPGRVLDWPMPLYIGEMMVFARVGD